MAAAADDDVLGGEAGVDGEIDGLVRRVSGFGGPRDGIGQNDELYELLDGSCERLLDLGRLDNDQRLLDLFLVYVKFSAKPAPNMFMYLFARRKFVQLQSFWVEWAKSLQGVGDLNGSTFILSKALEKFPSDNSLIMSELSTVTEMLNCQSVRQQRHEPPLDLSVAKPRKSILKRRSASSSDAHYLLETRSAMAEDDKCIARSDKLVTKYLDETNQTFSGGKFVFAPITASTQLETPRPPTKLRRVSDNGQDDESFQNFSQDAEDVIRQKMCNMSIRHSPADPFSSKVQEMLMDVARLSRNSNYFEVRGDLRLPLAVGDVIGREQFSWTVSRLVGSGTFGKVYKCDAGPQVRVVGGRNREFCVKVQTENRLWEFHMLVELNERVKQVVDSYRMSSLFNFADQFIVFDNCSLLVAAYFEHGTLLDLVNWHKRRNISTALWMTTFYAVMITETVRILHACNIIHADIKPDNFLIRSIPRFRDHPSIYSPSPLVLIDFNRSIDLNLFPPGTDFVSQNLNKSIRCLEIFKNNNNRWKFQVDTYGLLATLHCLVFQTYLKPQKDANGWRTSSGFPRNYPVVWNQFFAHFLNSNDGSKERPDYQYWLDVFREQYGAACDQTRTSEKNYLSVEMLKN